MRSIAPSGIQKHFCMIFGSWDVSKTIWGIRFQISRIMNNLKVSWNLTRPRFTDNFSSYEHFSSLGHNPFKGDIIRQVQTHFYKTKGSLNIIKTIWDIRFQETRLSNIQEFWNMIPHFNFLFSWLPDIVQKCFCTPNGAMDLTFRMI